METIVKVCTRYNAWYAKYIEQNKESNVTAW